MPEVDFQSIESSAGKNGRNEGLADRLVSRRLPNIHRFVRSNFNYFEILARISSQSTIYLGTMRRRFNTFKARKISAGTLQSHAKDEVKSHTC